MSQYSSILNQMAEGTLDTRESVPYIAPLEMPPMRAWKPGSINIDWQVTPRFHQGSGTVFGGYIAAIADHAAGLCMLTVLEDDRFFATHSMQTTLFKPIQAGTISVEASAINAGKSLVNIEVCFTSADQDLLAKSTIVQRVTSV